MSEFNFTLEFVIVDEHNKTILVITKNFTVDPELWQKKNLPLPYLESLSSNHNSDLYLLKNSTFHNKTYPVPTHWTPLYFAQKSARQNEFCSMSSHYTNSTPYSTVQDKRLDISSIGYLTDVDMIRPIPNLNLTKKGDYSDNLTINTFNQTVFISVIMVIITGVIWRFYYRNAVDLTSHLKNSKHYRPETDQTSPFGQATGRGELSGQQTLTNHLDDVEWIQFKKNSPNRGHANSDLSTDSDSSMPIKPNPSISPNKIYSNSFDVFERSFYNLINKTSQSYHIAIRQPTLFTRDLSPFHRMKTNLVNRFNTFKVAFDLKMEKKALLEKIEQFNKANLNDVLEAQKAYQYTSVELLLIGFCNLLINISYRLINSLLHVTSRSTLPITFFNPVHPFLNSTIELRKNLDQINLTVDNKESELSNLIGYTPSIITA